MTHQDDQLLLVMEQRLRELTEAVEALVSAVPQSQGDEEHASEAA